MLALLFGLLLDCSLPAAAQEHFFSAQSAAASPPVFSARLENSLPSVVPASSPALLPAAFSSRPLPFSPWDNRGPNRIPPGRPAAASSPVLSAPLEVQLPLVTALPVVYPAPAGLGLRVLSLRGMDNRGEQPISRIISSIRSVATPIVQQRRLPIAAFWGGRLQLGAFESVYPMENVVLGLPVSGSSAPRARSGARLPRGRKSYGLTVWVQLGRGSQPGGRFPVWHGLPWLGRASRN